MSLGALQAEVAEPEFLRCARAFEAECDYVHRALCRHGVRRQDAADLVQEVFLVMWRRWGHFESDRPLRPWLAGIAFKIAHAHHRRFSRREIPSDMIEPVADTPGPDDQLAHTRARQLVLAALARLPEMYRSVLVMHDLDGLSVQEIAALAESPRFTIHTRLRRARLQFAKLVHDLQAEPPSGRGAAAVGTEALLALERRSIAAPPEVRRQFRAHVQTLARAPRMAVPPPVARWPRAALVTVSLAALVLVTARIVRPARSQAPPPSVSASVPARPRAPIVLRAIPAPPVPTLATAAPAPAIPATPALDAGLVGHWSFDDGHGSAMARDLSGRGHDCTLRALDPAAAWGSGRAGGAVQLGTHGWLECPQPAAVARGPVAMTVSLWVNRQRPHTASTLVDRYLGPGTQVYFHFALRGSTLLLWSALWSGTTSYELETPLDGWVHLAFTHAGRTTKIFVGGALVAARDDTHPKSPGIVTTAPLIVGAFVKDPTRVWQHLDAAVDELRLYDRALSDAEIASLASSDR
jgi:RNA polymerase sigma-70 factor (ECF subfamily)